MSAIAPRWLLLIHQIPPKPSYLRVKVWRRLKRLGAVALKNSVYVLPAGDQAREDFQWVRREIVARGGDASVCEAAFVDGLLDREIEALFRAARDADYREIAESARAASRAVGSRRRSGEPRLADRDAERERLARRLSEVGAIDFFGATARKAAELAVAGLATKPRGADSPAPEVGRRARREDYRGRTWVTRKNVFVDRIASAWLIRRFIDPRARFKFVPESGYRPEKREVRFDMFEAEFTHEGDRCTFEVLVERFGLREPALRPIGEIVHDIDMKDSKFARQDALGVEQVLRGVARDRRDDKGRLDLGVPVFESLYAHFKSSRS